MTSGRYAVRLIRLGTATSEVGVDVRAALASWGPGDPVVGGIALAGAQPPDCPRPIDAIIVLPRGIIVVVGIDLPDPAVRLDAPLTAQWKTDGWPLVRRDGAVNPGIEALEAAGAISVHLERSRVEPLPLGTVVAVGPYVSQVFQPTADLARGVRILHPEPMTLLTAARELAVYQRRCSVESARRIIAALAPDAPLPDLAELKAEGFSDAVLPDLALASTTIIPRVTEPVVRPPKPAARRGQLRWLPIGAAVLVALLLITGIVFAMTSAGSGADETATRNTNATPTKPPGLVVDGVAFEPKGTVSATDCANHAYGDVQVWLQANPCGQLIRLRYESPSDNHRAAILVAVLRFENAASAGELRAVADKPGGGAVTDLSAEGTPWPGTGKPFFESAAYASGREGNSVKLVQAVWMDQPSTPDDPVLKDMAAKALDLPVTG
jgi:hypothetical protein